MKGVLIYYLFFSLCLSLASFSLFILPQITMDTAVNVPSASEALYRLVVMTLTLGPCVRSTPVPTDGPTCAASETARYKLTFSGKWTQAAFPKQYPFYRPPAQWSTLIGKSTASWFSSAIGSRRGTECQSEGTDSGRNM